MLHFVGFIGLTSCVMNVGGLRAYGPVWLVSSDDVRNAVAADQKVRHDLSQYKIDHVDIADHNTIEIYHQPNTFNYCKVQRVAGKWRYTGEVLVID